MELTQCPLCKHEQTTLFEDLTKEHDQRLYYHCENCDLVFADPKSWLIPEEEKKRYEIHQNDSDDERYRAFLDKLLVPLSKKITDHSRGLDFGCGPGPTISVMMSERGHDMKNYDPFFCDDKSVFNETFQFITCTEVLEHMFRPMVELKLMVSLLEQEGVLGLMTEFREDVDFKTWWYKNDPTHICFYSKKTFKWIADQLNCLVEFHGSSVAILSDFRSIE